MIDSAFTADPAVRALLARHPFVVQVGEGVSAGVEFFQGGRRREVRVGDTGAETFGLIELMDNNPLVCANVVSVPSPAATLALIALGPAAAAGLLVEPPVLVSSVAADEEDVGLFLASAGELAEITVHCELQDLDGVAAAAGMASVWTPDRPEDVGELYEERFGRSFFVRRDETSIWDPSLVRGTPYAVYRVTLGVDAEQSFLTVRVLADVKGKLGAAQVVHAMNVMCGFEESLGTA